MIKSKASSPSFGTSRIQIASCTAPNAINQTINLQGLKLVPDHDSVSSASDPSEAASAGYAKDR